MNILTVMREIGRITVITLTVSLKCFVVTYLRQNAELMRRNDVYPIT